ncbi:hypothetical protein [Actinoplanes sp. NPDC026670]|uniref:hypothetical protein n=1 Tax=Actinoplanes sp. NPDC026670 TaxID=3154700 RepID=UPI0033DAF226
MSYTRELVERLLPAVWDRWFVYSGLDNPYKPDPDMPKVKANPKTGNTIYAYLTDIHAGWKYAPLSLAERRALFLRFGLDLTLVRVGDQLGMRKQSAAELVDAGVGRLAAYLNGDDEDDEDTEASTTA